MSQKIERNESYRRSRARELFEYLSNEKYKAAHEMIDPRARDSLPVSHLKSKWKDLASGRSELRNVETVREDRTVVRFCRGEEYFRIDLSFNEDGYVRMIFFHLNEDPIPAGYSAPDYVSSELQSEDIGIDVGEHTLYGEAVFPQGDTARPCVVILPGSGTTDMDGATGTSRPYRDLAYGLASHGYVTYRYNKRPVSATETVRNRLIHDAQKVIEQIRTLEQVDESRMTICGHSLGGFLAPLVCDKGEIADAVILGAPCGDIRETAVNQLDAELSVQEFQTLVTEREKTEQLLGYSVSFWKDVARQRPAEVANQTGIRLYVGYGGQDELVGESSFNRWCETVDTDQITADKYPELDHTLLLAEEDETEKSHVPEKVIANIAEWLSGG